MPPTLADRVAHILHAIQRIQRLTEGKSFEAFLDDEDLRASLERYLERISEASRHVPPEIKISRPEISWQQMADLGTGFVTPITTSIRRSYGISSTIISAH